MKRRIKKKRHNLRKGPTMKLGTHIMMDDGREATVVYHGLDGDGIMWGLHDPDPKDFEGTSGGMFDDAIPDFQWCPEAMLRDPWDGCEKAGWTKDQCVGREFEILQDE